MIYFMVLIFSDELTENQDATKRLVILIQLSFL